MSGYFGGFIILTILAVVVQGSPKTVNVNNLPDFDVLDITIEASDHLKTIVIYINEKYLIVNYTTNEISYLLKNIRPTNDGVRRTEPPFLYRNIVHYIKDTELPEFDLLNITIDKIDGMKSEKIIKIFVNDKILGLDTRGEQIEVYLKDKDFENGHGYMSRSSATDNDGTSITYLGDTWKRPENYHNSSSGKKKGNNADIKGANCFIVLGFIFWQLIR